jgi:hypothetical protein
MGGSVNIVAALGSRGAVSDRPLSPVPTTLLVPSQSNRAHHGLRGGKVDRKTIRLQGVIFSIAVN